MEEFKLEILSSRDEINGQVKNACYLCEATLEEYVKSIPKRYRDYDVQRGIVANVYLDKLTETILNKKFIPPIVLIAEKHNENPTNELKITEYKILDGLQRTFRIKAIYSALTLFIENYTNINQEMTKYNLSKQFKDKLVNIGSDINIFWTIVRIYFDEKKDIEDLKSVFKGSLQWFEVWSSLEKKEQINKMLILNAGHKPMDIKHQLELLFLNIISDEQLKQFVGAKDVNSSFFYSKKEEGQIHLSHFISAILAFDKAEPITVDSKYLQKLQENLDTELEKLKFYFQNGNLEKLIELMEKLDKLFNENYQEDSSNKKIGLEWLGRETILIGIFASFGLYYQKRKKEEEEIEFSTILNEIYKEISENISVFNIQNFNECKTSSIDITKVNIGNIFKYTTFNAMKELLISNDTNIIDWDMYFKFGTKVYHAS